MQEVRPHRVTLSVVSEHEFTVDARTPEEAEDIAAEYFKDGERGSVTFQEIAGAEAYSEDDEGLAFAEAA